MLVLTIRHKSWECNITCYPIAVGMQHAVHLGFHLQWITKIEWSLLVYSNILHLIGFIVEVFLSHCC